MPKSLIFSKIIGKSKQKLNAESFSNHESADSAPPPTEVQELSEADFERIDAERAATRAGNEAAEANHRHFEVAQLENLSRQIESVRPEANFDFSQIEHLEPDAIDNLEFTARGQFDWMAERMDVSDPQLAAELQQKIAERVQTVARNVAEHDTTLFARTSSFLSRLTNGFVGREITAGEFEKVEASIRDTSFRLVGLQHTFEQQGLSREDALRQALTAYGDGSEIRGEIGEVEIDEVTSEKLANDFANVMTLDMGDRFVQAVEIGDRQQVEKLVKEAEVRLGIEIIGGEVLSRSLGRLAGFLRGRSEGLARRFDELLPEMNFGGGSRSASTIERIEPMRMVGEAVENRRGIGRQEIDRLMDSLEREFKAGDVERMISGIEDVGFENVGKLNKFIRGENPNLDLSLVADDLNRLANWMQRVSTNPNISTRQKKRLASELERTVVEMRDAISKNPSIEKILQAGISQIKNIVK